MSWFAKLRAETHLPGFDGATGWLNSEPLTPEGLRGKVVLVDFWTYTCINWLRTLGYVRAWHEKYEASRAGRCRRPHAGVPVRARRRQRPLGRGGRCASSIRSRSTPTTRVWRAFDNNYWPAVYIADVEGRIRHQHFGEGGYEECEMVIQMLLREAGHDDVGATWSRSPTRASRRRPTGRTWRSPETYLGYEQAQNFVSANSPSSTSPRTSACRIVLELNQWALSGNWTLGPGRERAERSRREPRVPLPRTRRQSRHGARLKEARPSRSACESTDEPPGDAHGLDVDEERRRNTRSAAPAIS